mgnify:CR=1 FL=1
MIQKAAAKGSKRNVCPECNNKSLETRDKLESGGGTDLVTTLQYCEICNYHKVNEPYWNTDY